MPTAAIRYDRSARRAGLLLATLLVVALAGLGPLDNLARANVDAGLKRALVTFALARTANAIISVLQETTISIGVASTQPFQALDPINDLVEQFSLLMLAACASFGVQKILIALGALPAIWVPLAVAMIAWAVYRWRGREPPPLLTRILVVLLFARFAVPIASTGSELAFRAAMLGDYEAASLQVQNASTSIDAMAQPKPEGQTFLGRLADRINEMKSAIPEKYAEIKARAEGAVQYVVTLIALFIVQTVILPIAFLWLTYRLFGAAFRPAVRH